MLQEHGARQRIPLEQTLMRRSGSFPDIYAHTPSKTREQLMQYFSGFPTPIAEILTSEHEIAYELHKHLHKKHEDALNHVTAVYERLEGLKLIINYVESRGHEASAVRRHKIRIEQELNCILYNEQLDARLIVSTDLLLLPEDQAHQEK